MTEEPYAPHETRMLALQMSVEFVNGDKSSKNIYAAEDIIHTARKFESYLTGKPVDGFDATDIADDDGQGLKR